MPYTISQLAKVAGITVRTLHHYDHIGLLEPATIAKNGYRVYGQGELLQLQQIMFFRELDFSLEDIKHILTSPHFNMRAALEDHKRLIKIKTKRLKKLITTIDITIKKMTTNQPINNNELYGGFTNEEATRYQAEARQRWGHTDAYKQSEERTKKMAPQDFAKIKTDGDTLMHTIVSAMPNGPTHASTQQLIAKHFEGLRTFYEPTLEIYRGLAHMYIQDERFADYFRKYHPDLPQFMSSAMLFFCDQKKHTALANRCD